MADVWTHRTWTVKPGREDASRAFREGVAGMEDLLESFEVRTLDEVGLGG
jgi:hypothetical protein